MFFYAVTIINSFVIVIPVVMKLIGSHFMQGVDENNLLLDQEHITLEFASISDGKGAVTKAANILFMMYLKSADSGGSSAESIFTEPHMAEALKAVGLF